MTFLVDSRGGSLMARFLFTSESVTEGHPDKVADKVSDAILDAYLSQDRDSRVACETLITRGVMIIAGEITSNGVVDVREVAKGALRDIGYISEETGFSVDNAGILISLQKQSPDIAMGVDTGGAGDQGMMFGFACNETDTFMPMPIYLAHRLAMRLTEVRKNGILPYLRPDGKSQVTVEYEDGKPVRILNVVISAHHSSGIDMGQLREDIKREVIYNVLPEGMYDREALECHINATGRFELGGPAADTGLTGRKIIVDTYGGMGRHGGGCFSGKDPTKVDRSAAYMARYVAKNIVAAGLADRCEVQFAYVIGVAHPLSVMVNTFGTGKVSDERIVEIINQVFDLTPNGIINALDLKRPIYYDTAAYGHFGRELDHFTWERLDRVDQIRSLAFA